MRPRPAPARWIPDAFASNGFPLVEFDRKPLDSEPLRAFALAWNADLTIVQFLDTGIFCLNGYYVFPNSTVRRWREIPESSFAARAAAHNKLRPSLPKGIKGASMRVAIESVGAAFPLIVISRERIRKNACEIGRLRRTTQRSVTIRSISPNAEWENDEKFALSDITLLGFGGEYERLLYSLATSKPVRAR